MVATGARDDTLSSFAAGLLKNVAALQNRRHTAATGSTFREAL